MRSSTASLVPVFALFFISGTATADIFDPGPEGDEAKLLEEALPDNPVRGSSEEEAGGYLGVVLAPVPEALRAHLKLEGGAMIEELLPGSPADKAGLRIYDVVVKLNGEGLRAPEELKNRIRSAKAGEALKLDVKRGQESLSLDVTLGSPSPKYKEKYKEKPDKWERRDRDRPGFLGVGFSEVPEDIAFHLNIEEGAGVMVIDVSKGSPAEKAGIEPKDLLLSVDGSGIQGSQHFSRLIGERKPGEEVQIDLIHKGERKKVKVVLAPRPRSLPWGGPGPGLRGRPDRFFFWGPRVDRGRIILQEPDGREHSFPIPDAFFKAKESAEDLFQDLEGKFDKFKDTQIPEIKEKLRKSLRELENQLRQGGDREWPSTEDRRMILRNVDGGYDITVQDQNGLRTVTVKKGKESVAEDLPYEKLDTLPEDVRERVKKVVETFQVVPDPMTPRAWKLRGGPRPHDPARPALDPDQEGGKKIRA